MQQGEGGAEAGVRSAEDMVRKEGGVISFSCGRHACCTPTGVTKEGELSQHDPKNSPPPTLQLTPLLVRLNKQACCRHESETRVGDYRVTLLAPRRKLCLMKCGSVRVLK